MFRPPDENIPPVINKVLLLLIVASTIIASYMAYKDAQALKPPVEQPAPTIEKSN